MIEFSVEQDKLVLKYSSELRGGDWIAEELRTSGEVTINRVFTLVRGDLLERPLEGLDIHAPDFEGLDFEDLNADDPDGAQGEVEYRFRFAKREGEYYRVEGRVFGVPNGILLADRGIIFDRKLFVAERNISIFRRLAEVIGPRQDIVVGGDRSGSIPVEVFEELLRKFPTSTELDRYANARVSNIIGEYFDGMKDFRGQYEKYLSQRKSMVPAGKIRDVELVESEIAKFLLIRDTIREWLASSEGRTEKEWQHKILTFILLLFPKYVAVLENVKIEDHYSKPGSTKDRFIDLALVDANGNLDVIEIKRPFDDLLLSKTPYRDNFVPTKSLSGTIMQAEKYLFHLSKWGIAGEIKLTKRYRKQLLPGMSIQIANPKAILILGRDRNADGSSPLDQRQTFDLEVIKRKYTNMIDIITYDDLLRRLDNIITSLQRRADASQT